MTWTYSGNPASSTTDEVRFLVGDTDTTDQQVQNEEIDWAISEFPTNTRLAAALVCRALAAKYSKYATSRVGDISQNCSDIAKAYLDLVKKYDPSGVTSGVAIVLPKFGGLSISEKETLAEDSDAVQPSFSRGMNDITGGPGDGVVSRSDEDWVR